MGITLCLAELGQCLTKQAAVLNDMNILLLKPGREIVLAPVVNQVRDKGSMPASGPDRDLQHIRVLAKCRRVFGESKKRMHDGKVCDIWRSAESASNASVGKRPRRVLGDSAN